MTEAVYHGRGRNSGFLRVTCLDEFVEATVGQAGGGWMGQDGSPSILFSFIIFPYISFCPGVIDLDILGS